MGKLGFIFHTGRWWLAFCAAVALTVLGSAALGASRGADEPVVVIVNPAVQQSMDDSQLRSIYTMRLRRWSNGQAIRVFVLPDGHPAHIRFAEQRLRVFPHLLRRTWDRLFHSGTGDSPIEVPNEARMREAVATTPGAIGYLSGSAPNEGVRIVHTQDGGSL